MVVKSPVTLMYRIDLGCQSGLETESKFPLSISIPIGRREGKTTTLCTDIHFIEISARNLVNRM